MSESQPVVTSSTWRGPSSRIYSTWCVLKSPFKSYREWRAKYGDTLRVRALNGDVIVSCDLDFVKDFIKLKSEDHVPFGMNAIAPVFGAGSLLALNGRRHARERKLLLPPFHGERMKTYLKVIRSVAQEYVSEWGGDLTLTDEVMPISLDVITQVIFGARDAERVQMYRRLIRDFIGRFKPVFLFSPSTQISFFGLSPWDRFRSAQEALKSQLMREIESRRDAELGEDILSLLLQATYDDGEAMRDEDIVDELITLLIAGHETTQITIAWALYWIYRHPDTLTKLREELAQAEGIEDESERLNYILKSPHLDAVVNETLRIDPIVPDVLRTLTVDKSIGGYIYPAGTHIAVVTAMLHTREDLYPNPNDFLPQRWLDQKPRPWTFFPFGGGARRCIGAALAIAEVKIVLAEVIGSLDLEIKGAERSQRVNVVMAPSKGVRATVRRREA